MQCHHPRNKQAGFTLIELLLALFMFSIITTAVFASFSAISDGVEQGRQRTELSHVGRAAIQRLAQELASTSRIRYTDCLEDLPAYICEPMQGENDEANGVDRDRIMFLTMPVQRFPETVPRGSLCDVCYYIANNAQRQPALFRFVDCTLDKKQDDDERCGSAREDETLKPLELTDAIVGLNVTYFGPDNEELETWPPDDPQDEKPLPCQVRITLTPKEAPPGQVVETIVNLPIQQAACESAVDES